MKGEGPTVVGKGVALPPWTWLRLDTLATLWGCSRSRAIRRVIDKAAL